MRAVFNRHKDTVEMLLDLNVDVGAQKVYVNGMGF